MQQFLSLLMKKNILLFNYKKKRLKIRTLFLTFFYGKRVSMEHNNEKALLTR